MHGGRVVATGTPQDVLTAEHLAAVYRIDAQLATHRRCAGCAAPCPAAMMCARCVIAADGGSNWGATLWGSSVGSNASIWRSKAAERMARSPGACSTVCSRTRRSTSPGSARPAPAPSMRSPSPPALPNSGRAGARTKLREVWEAVAKAGLPDLLRLNPLLAGISRSNAMAQMATLFSPYDFNPLGFDPFRKLLVRTSTSRLLRTTPGPELLIAATDVTTGRPAPVPAPRDHGGVRARLCLPADHPSCRDHRRPGLLGRRLLGQSRPADARPAKARLPTR